MPQKNETTNLEVVYDFRFTIVYLRIFLLILLYESGESEHRAQTHLER